jgi:hypothetical protein
MILFLDDNPERLFLFKSSVPSARLAATAEEMIDLIKRHKGSDIECLYLDHDLGGKIYVDSNDKETGMEVVRWIIENHPSIKNIVIHSHNTDAAQLMLVALLRAGYVVECIPFIDLKLRELSAVYHDVLVEEE